MTDEGQPTPLGKKAGGTQTEPGAPRPRTAKPNHVGRYIVLDTLGAGSYGVVFQAYDPDLDRKVALKVLKHARSEAQQTRFIREAQAIAQLQHPNVVSIYDVGEDDGRFFIAMELVEGAPLDAWLAQRPKAPSEEILDIFEQAGAGLKSAHEKGIVHRDFKPANVLVGDDGVVRVADFGLARSFARPEAKAPLPDQNRSSALGNTVTVDGAIVGTPAYMAPEQALGHSATELADQYAFCVSFYEALAGARPLELPSMPSERGVPSWLQLAIEKGLAENPSDRHSSMRALLELIKHRRERRARWSKNALIALSLSVLVFALVLAKNTGPRCDGFEVQAERALPQAQLEKIQNAFLTTDAPYKREAWQIVSAQLTNHSSEWTKARTDACEATHLRGEQSAHMLDLRSSCLDQRLIELEELSGVLARADKSMVERSATAVSQLTPISICADTKALLSATPKPTAPEKRRVIETVERKIARLSALHQAGLFLEGKRLAKDTLALIEPVDFPPATAKVQLWRGLHSIGADALEAGKESLLESMLQADRGRDDRLRLRTYIELIRVDDGSKKTSDATDRLVLHARAILDRIEVERVDALERARLDRALSALYRRRGAYAMARERAEAAVELLNALPKDHPERVETLYTLGTILADLGLRKEAAALYARTERMARDALSAGHPRVGELQAEAGMAYGFLGEHQTSEAYARSALDNARLNFGEKHSRTGRGWHVLGNTLYNQNRYPEAKEAYTNAYQINALVFGERSRKALGLLANIAFSENRMGELKSAETNFSRALKGYRAALGPAHPQVGAALGWLAWVVGERGRKKEAVKMYQEAIKILTKSNPEHPRLLDCIRGIAKYLLELQDQTAARTYLLRGLALSKVVDEAPKYTAELEFMTAKALSNSEPKRATKLANTALARVKDEPVAKDLHQEIARWLAR